MATTTYNGHIAGSQSKGFFAGLAHAAHNAIETLTLWQRRREQRRYLLSLDDRLLRDIGLSRVEAEVEADKPFWRA